MTDLARARAALDAAHAADPREERGHAGEALYADRIEEWVARLLSPPSDALRLAARAQHLERWAIPRADFPEGRGGYLRWRSAVHARQGARVREILAAAGSEAALTERVAVLVAKAAPRGDAEAQAIEDAACLVFLQHELADFAGQHPREKTVEVLRKTWRKMSPAGQDAARALPLDPVAASLVAEALGGDG
jgi:tRNAThr (cytosine32-N3)-methyltransferase